MSGEAKLTETPPVRRRTVFYVAGFDPKGPAFYHDIYRREAPLQAAINGMQITVGERARRGKHHAR